MIKSALRYTLATLTIAAAACGGGSLDHGDLAASDLGTPAVDLASELDASHSDLATSSQDLIGADLTSFASADLASVGDLAVAGDLAVSYALDVTLEGTGFGRVSTADSSIDCGTVCGASFAAGTMITLTASPDSSASKSSVFGGWSGACNGLGDCVVTLDVAHSVTANFRLAPNVVFVTAAVFSANFGSLANADDACQAAALAAGHPGNYKAFLGTDATSIASRFGDAAGWVRFDGRAVANTFAELAESSVVYPIRIDEHGVDVGEVPVWTGASSDATVASNANCANWTSSDVAFYAAIGHSSGTASMAVSFESLPCNAQAHLYCFEVDRTVTVKPQVYVANPRRAFISNGGFATTGGLAAADALCSSEASAAGLSGSFKALLPSIGASAASRFDPSGAPWARVDDALLKLDPSEMFTATYWDTSLNLTADGTTFIGNNDAWGGGTTLTLVGGDGWTCSGWTSTSGSAAAGRAGFTRVYDLLSYDSGSGCGQSFHVYCLQE